MSKLGRNELCHCSSGLKYKKCCMKKDEEAARIAEAAKGKRTFQAVSDIVRLVDQEMTWENPIYPELAHHLIASMRQDYKYEHIAMAIMIWHDYTTTIKPTFRKMGAFSAALEYMVSEVTDTARTQNELAEKYEVSATTVSKRYQEMATFLMKQLDEKDQE